MKRSIRASATGRRRHLRQT